MFTLQQNVPLAPLTTIRLGGPARWFAHCRSRQDITDSLQAARTPKLAVHVLGGGSNTIFPDSGFAGLVLQVDLRGIAFKDEGGAMLACAAAGEDWDPFVAECVARNLGGVECMSGIPGLVGATPMQNVGAYGQEVADAIVSVEAVDITDGRLVTFTNKECRFGHRTSRFKEEDSGRYIITGVTFRLPKDGQPTLVYEQVREAVMGEASLAQVRAIVLGLRRKKSMVVREDDPHSRSCGSFFINPRLTAKGLGELQQKAHTMGITESLPTFPAEDGKVDVPAAWIIEKAGFPKGLRRDGVGISPNHNLALVNYGGTTAQLLALAAEIQQGVQKTFGITLIREPVVAG